MDVIMSPELLKWNYNNLFKEMYKDKENKKDVIYHFVTEISGATDYLDENEKLGVSSIIDEKNLGLHIYIQRYKRKGLNNFPNLNSFEEIFNYNKKLRAELKKTKEEFWHGVYQHYDVGEEGSAII